MSLNAAPADPKPDLRYNSRTGEVTLHDEFQGTGYSGRGICRNQPGLEMVKSRGPIPRGLYTIGTALPVSNLGPIAIPLYPLGHNARGRSGFYIHGDNKTNDASKGCIILGRALREKIASSAKTLEVYS